MAGIISRQEQQMGSMTHELTAFRKMSESLKQGIDGLDGGDGLLALYRKMEEKDAELAKMHHKMKEKEFEFAQEQVQMGETIRMLEGKLGDTVTQVPIASEISSSI